MACPVCLKSIRSGDRRCSRCREDLTLEDPLAVVRRLGIEWPAADVALAETLPEGFGSVDPERLRLRELAEEILIAPGEAYAGLRCLAGSSLEQTIERYPHQVATVQRVLGDLEGRALLADEVGLGKTIEAGLVLAELRARQLCSRALILVPPALLDQWYVELRQKLELPVVHLDDPAQAQQSPLIALLSIYTAKGPRFSAALLEQTWDLVIVDEAHRLRNAAPLLHRFVRQLRTHRLLLLTATPLHNSVEDLHALVSW